MIGIENKVWVQIQDCERVYPIADEDMERDNASKTSAVHFLRFELTPSMIAAVHSGATIQAGIDHPAYCVSATQLASTIRDSLANDLDPTAIN